jgi:hypothetical protein
MVLQGAMGNPTGHQPGNAAACANRQGLYGTRDERPTQESRVSYMIHPQTFPPTRSEQLASAGVQRLQTIEGAKGSPRQPRPRSGTDRPASPGGRDSPARQWPGRGAADPPGLSSTWPRVLLEVERVVVLCTLLIQPRLQCVLWEDHPASACPTWDPSAHISIGLRGGCRNPLSRDPGCKPIPLPADR